MCVNVSIHKKTNVGFCVQIFSYVDIWKYKEWKMIISVVNQKGGVGKTITSINLAAGLAKHGKKTLIVDMDKQANTTKTLNVERIRWTIGNVLLKNCQLKDDGVILPVQHPEEGHHIDNLYICPSSIRLAKTKELLYTKPFKEAILNQCLESIRDDYDYIIIDSPPDLDVLVHNVIYASDFLLIPCELDLSSIDGMADLLDVVKVITQNLNKMVLKKILITKFEKSTTVTNNHVLNILEDFKKAENIDMLNTIIAKNNDLRKASMVGHSIFDYDQKRETSGLKSYDNLVKEIIEYEFENIQAV